MTQRRIAVLAIDPQYDFHDIPVEQQVISGIDADGKPKRIKPALAVPGAWDDAIALGLFIKRLTPVISKIIVTLDTHQRYDIAHPLYWLDANNQSPAPFTEITNEDIVSGKWRPVNPALMSHVLSYTKELETKGKYKLYIWPPHCLVGEPGHNIVQPVMEAIQEWEETRFTRYTPLSKGHNPHTEHYGGCEAEVPMADDSTTRLNKQFIKAIEANDLVFITGQALSHCVAATVLQIAENFDPENIKKLVLLEDTTSAIDGFEQNAKDFIETMKAKGMQVVKSTDVIVGRDGELNI